MSFANFIPTVWNATVNKDLERKSIFCNWVNKEYEGDVAQVGDSIRILNAGRPTIKSFDWSKKEDRAKFAGFNGGIGDAEEIDGSSTTLQINQIAYFSFLVNDIDKAQAKGNQLQTYQDEASTLIASEIDSYIASFAKAAPHYKNGVSQSLNVNNVLKTINSMKTALLKKDVPKTSELKMEIPFELYQIMLEAYEHFATSNVEELKSGECGKYNNITFPSSNNIYVDEDGKYHAMLRTKRSLAFVNPFTHSEPYRPEKGFSDAIKGFALYDAKIVRPKEILAIKFNVDTETEKILNTKTVTQ